MRAGALATATAAAGNIYKNGEELRPCKRRLKRYQKKKKEQNNGDLPFFVVHVCIDHAVHVDNKKACRDAPYSSNC